MKEKMTIMPIAAKNAANIVGAKMMTNRAIKISSIFANLLSQYYKHRPQHLRVG